MDLDGEMVVQIAGRVCTFRYMITVAVMSCHRHHWSAAWVSVPGNMPF